jgi:hypothetical protein
LSSPPIGSEVAHGTRRDGIEFGKHSVGCLGEKQMNLVPDIWSVLTPRQRRWVLGAQILSIVMAFSTVAGIASIGPFFSVLGNPDLIDQSRLLHWLYVGGFQSRRSFTVTLGLAFAGVVLLANLINVCGSFVMTRLALWIGTICNLHYSQSISTDPSSFMRALRAQCYSRTSSMKQIA